METRGVLRTACSGWCTGRLVTRSAIVVASGTVIPRSASIRGTDAPVAKTAAFTPSNSPSPVATPATEPAWVQTVHLPALVTESRPPRPEILDQKLNEAWQVDHPSPGFQMAPMSGMAAAVTPGV